MYGSDLLGVYDIQDPIRNCLEDIILRLFSSFAKTFRLPSRITYNGVSLPFTTFTYYNPDQPFNRSCQKDRHVAPTYS